MNIYSVRCAAQFGGALGRSRTGTVSLPGDFESPTSTNSITRAQEYSILFLEVAQEKLTESRKESKLLALTYNEC